MEDACGSIQSVVAVPFAAKIPVSGLAIGFASFYRYLYLFISRGQSL